MSFALASLAVVVGAACAFAALERRFPYDRGQRLFREGFWVDLVGYGLAQSYLLGLLIAALLRALDGATGLSRLGLLRPWPGWAQLGLFFVTHDFYIYWFHRLQHRSWLLWRTHEAHHSVRAVDWLAGSRSHALEILVNQTVEFAPIVLLGADARIVVLKATLDAVWGMYIHSNIDVRSGVLQYVINGPEMHRWHHATDVRDINFGTKLAVWDWLFGTAFRPAARKPAGYGLEGVEFPRSFLRQQLFAFRRA